MRVSAREALRGSTDGPRNILELHKEMAFRVGHREGIASRVAELLTDKERATELREAIHAAATDKEALDIARQAFLSEEARLTQELAPVSAQIAHLDRIKVAAYDVMDWLEAPHVLGAAAASAFHKVGPQNTMVLTKDRSFLPPEIEAAQTGQLGVFLIQHDWAGLLASADVDQGGYRLPFDYCCFEFDISGRRVCALIACENGEPYRMIPIIRATGGWLIPVSYSLNGTSLTAEYEHTDAPEPPPGLAQVIMAHVRAVAITLDAEVVNSEVVRAPHKLNIARIKRGERPIYDHHVLTLNRRPRPTSLPAPGASGHHKRLHFRRGHWRHYPTHKTWIRWCLVGDPTLGFADKDYRL